MLEMYMPPTLTKTKINTGRTVNRKIKERTESNIRKFRDGNQEEIEERIHQLNHEWDVERFLEVNFAGATLLSAVLGFTVNKKWLALGGVASVFMLQHAVQGWCPPLTFARHLGFRTIEEINKEKESLEQMLNKINSLETIRNYNPHKKEPV